MSLTRLVGVLTLSVLLSACTNDEVFIGVGGTRLNEVGYKIKQLAFSWPSVSGADTYRLLENPDGVSGYTQIDGDFPSTTTSYDYDIAVHLQDWENASYILQSCISGDCTDSAARFATDSSAAIGYFKASNTGMDDNFGNAVAVSDDGNTMAVGAWAEDSASDANDNSGAVYLFVRNSAGWQAWQYLKASNFGAGDGFGYSVALSEDGATLAVGAWREKNGTVNATGAVYIFERDVMDNWGEQMILRASNAEHDDRFGQALALSDDGNTLVVGAPGEDSDGSGGADNSASESGAVYTFTRDGAGWSQQALLKASTVLANANFGQAVAINGNGMVLAGGAWRESGDATEQGAAYIYTYGIDWSSVVRLTASDGEANDRFGGTVALSDDGATLAVGAYKADNGVATDTGAAYVFVNTGSWTQQQIITPDVGYVDSGDEFGWSVALGGITGDILAVGAMQEDGTAKGMGGDPTIGFENAAGAAYVFTRDAATWSQYAYVKASNTEAGDGFGAALAMSADGQTLAVGATGEDSAATGIAGDQGSNTNSNAGAVYLY